MSTITPAGVVVLDVEATDLDGDIFAAAAIAYSYRLGQVTATWTSRCPTRRPCSEWVQTNVLPALDDPTTGIIVDCESYAGLRESWRTWYADYHQTHLVLTHCATPLEAALLRDAHRNRTAVEAPHPVLDLATTLYDNGYDPTSVDSYLEQTGRTLAGPAHNPLHDCRAILRAHLALRRERNELLTVAATSRRRWLNRWARRQRRCMHQAPGDTTWVTKAHTDYGRIVWHCRGCRQFWIT